MGEGGTARATRRVMLVDDEALIRMGLRVMLQALGYEVVGEAADGKEAIEKVAALNPDVVIMDIKMPGVDGLEATRRIMATHPVPIIVLTAYNQRSLVEEAADSGVLAYLMKPVRESEIGPAIEVARARFADLRWLDRARRGPDTGRAAGEPSYRATDNIEAASQILRTRYRLTEAEAASRLRQLARSSRRTLSDVADAIIALENP